MFPQHGAVTPRSVNRAGHRSCRSSGTTQHHGRYNVSRGQLASSPLRAQPNQVTIGSLYLNLQGLSGRQVGSKQASGRRARRDRRSILVGVRANDICAIGKNARSETRSPLSSTFFVFTPTSFLLTSVPGPVLIVVKLGTGKHCLIVSSGYLSLLRSGNFTRLPQPWGNVDALLHNDPHT